MTPEATLGTALLAYAGANGLVGLFMLTFPRALWVSIGGADPLYEKAYASTRAAGAMMVTLAIAALLVIRKPARQSTLVTLLCLEETLVAVATVRQRRLRQGPHRRLVRLADRPRLHRPGRLHVVGPHRGPQGPEGGLNRPPRHGARAPAGPREESSLAATRSAVRFIYNFERTVQSPGAAGCRRRPTRRPLPEPGKPEDAARHTAGAPSEEGSWASGSSG